jgi:anti-anti-sigma regulatory factor
MLRITENFETGNAIRLRLDGTVSSEAFDELAEICGRHQLTNRLTIIVDMAGVNFMHDDAARQMAKMRGESLRIINCSPFIATLLDTVGRMD